MLAIKKARKLIEANPGSDASKALAALVVALETESAFNLGTLYALGDKPFQLALEILAEWRLDRHYAKKARLLDASTYVQQLNTPAAAPAAAPVEAAPADTGPAAPASAEVPASPTSDKA